MTRKTLDPLGPALVLAALFATPAAHAFQATKPETPVAPDSRTSSTAPPVKPTTEQKAAADPFAPTKAEPLPPGMTGSDVSDPRYKLKPGLYDAGEAAMGMEHVDFVKKPAAFQITGTDANDPQIKSALKMLGVSDPSKIPAAMQPVIAQLAFANSDFAFQGNHLFQGNFYGVNFWDISDPAKTTLITSLVCPGGQGDVSVYGNLLFMSVEMPNGRVDCGAQAFPPNPPIPAGHEKEMKYHLPVASKDRFRGVRIFDISDIRNPKQVGAVQTCRGSHTHTLVPDPNDPANVYVYVSGTSFVRQSEELEGCSSEAPDKDKDTSLFRIDVIKVPLAHPEEAKIVSSPRVFLNPTTGALNGLNNGGSHGDIEGKKGPKDTDQCHDITAYPAIGLAAGACSGNGLLLDISNPANPKRVDAVNDVNYSYWHSASFSNDGSKVVFTDEWGGGMQPRCRPTDPNIWGADAIFGLKDNKLKFDGYYKMPAAQSDTENCVAHNGSLVPVPGRDIEVQAWYQGGVSVMDFTDPKHAFEIAYFDRGPIDPKSVVLGGDWSAYWYNGYIYGSEIARGLDVFKLTPTKYLTQNEIDAALRVHVAEQNVQDQQKIVWPADFVVAKAYLDQLERDNAMPAAMIESLRSDIGRATRSHRSPGDMKRLEQTSRNVESQANGAVAPVDANRMHELAKILAAPAAS